MVIRDFDFEKRHRYSMIRREISHHSIEFRRVCIRTFEIGWLRILVACAPELANCEMVGRSWRRVGEKCSQAVNR